MPPTLSIPDLHAGAAKPRALSSFHVTGGVGPDEENLAINWRIEITRPAVPSVVSIFWVIPWLSAVETGATAHSNFAPTDAAAVFDRIDMLEIGMPQQTGGWMEPANWSSMSENLLQARHSQTSSHTESLRTTFVTKCTIKIAQSKCRTIIVFRFSW